MFDDCNGSDEGSFRKFSLLNLKKRTKILDWKSTSAVSLGLEDDELSSDVPPLFDSLHTGILSAHILIERNIKMKSMEDKEVSRFYLLVSGYY
jgi:hypothetical protein